MKIAVVTRHAGRVGGAETYLDLVVPELSRRGHSMAALFEDAPRGGEAFRWDQRGIPSWTASGDGTAALDALARWTPDVLFVHGVQSLELERRVLKIAPAVFFAHAYYGTCISGSKSHAFPRYEPCDRVFGPACLGCYYPRRCGGLSATTMLAEYRLQRGRLRTLASYDSILVASRHMAGEYGRHGLARNVRVVPLPIRLIGDVPASAAPSDRWRILYLGRLEKTKGTPLLLESIARVAASIGGPVALEIAGAGSLRSSLEARARQLTAQHAGLAIRFHGQLAPEACDRLIAQSHVLAMPSCWPEPFGLVGLEAARVGVPSVAFDVGGIREWLIHGRTGILVPAQPPDPRRFADAILRCLADLPALHVMGRRAREHASRFSVDAHLAQLEPLLAEACGHGAVVLS